MGKTKSVFGGVGAFVGGLFASVVVAWLFPDLCAKGGWLKSEVTARLGVFVIFFIQGVRLPREDLKKGMMHWRLHVFTQLMMFAGVPLMVLAGDMCWGGWMHPGLRFGLLYLAMLPTTIASCVILTTQAGGNVPGAIFNVTLGNVLGVFLVPLWAAWLLRSGADVSVPVLPLLGKISVLILLPMVLGQALRPWLGAWAHEWRGALHDLNTGIIFFIFCAAVSDSFQKGVWNSLDGVFLVQVVGFSWVVLGTATCAAWWGSRLWGLDRESRIAALFCGSQKTLAAGIPIANSVFAGVVGAGAQELPDLGIALLPLIIYHLSQLSLGGVMSALLARNKG